MRIKLTSIMVDDQDKALRFYTEIWGLRRSTIFRLVIPVDYRYVGGRARGCRAGPGTERQSGRQDLPGSDVPAGHSGAAFEVDRHRRRVSRASKPSAWCSPSNRHRPGPVTIAVFADTCGNLIQLYQPA